jgi:hypothetical protein
MLGVSVQVRRASAVAGVALVLSVSARAQPSASWLDRPLVNWNREPLSIGSGRPAGRVDAKCPALNPSTPPESAVKAAGLVPFLNFDQRLVREDVEIVGGAGGVDTSCAPVDYNLFVFVGGRFAGTLSPVAMVSRQDGSSGAVRILSADTISAEFARYTNKDSECCPSARMTVRYRIERSGRQPVVVPVDVRTTRTF